jgi:hypothetical protein|tara:strand:+ start:213 stop:389 length:177 start_codon:yes stop_codon:yes gene_type:complete
MKNKEYQAGARVEIRINDVWVTGVVEDNLSIQYFIALDNSRGSAYIFKHQTDIIRGIE